MKDSGSSRIINHEGVVQKNTGNSLLVSIISTSACAGCQANDSCTVSEKKEQIIEVHGRYNVLPGDVVTILMKKSLGFAALFLGYVFPLIAVLIILITLSSLKVPELVAGTVSLATLIPYYIVLSFFKKRINEKFTFTLKV